MRPPGRPPPTNPSTTKELGDAAEARALAHLEAAGLVLVRRNYRVARGPSSRGGEVDLVMRERDGTLVFVEVRRRSDDRFGGAAATVGSAKRRLRRRGSRSVGSTIPPSPAPASIRR